MSTRAIQREIVDQGRAPSRERLFDSLRLGEELRLTVDIWLMASSYKPEDANDAIEAYLMQQRVFCDCDVDSIGRTHSSGDPWWVVLATIMEIDGQQVRVTLSFTYDNGSRTSRSGVSISWTTARCHSVHPDMGCGELLWPHGDSVVCGDFPDCCTS